MLQFAQVGPLAPGKASTNSPRPRQRHVSKTFRPTSSRSSGRPKAPSYPQGEIQEILADHNIHADLSAIRQALRRWAERHMIIKNRHRYHALARAK